MFVVGGCDDGGRVRGGQVVHVLVMMLYSHGCVDTHVHVPCLHAVVRVGQHAL